MASRLSPTQRTLAELRQKGCRAAIVEKWNPHAGPHGVRQDLFGIIDVVALVPGEKGLLGVQATGAHGWASHWEKLTVEKAEETLAWLEAGLVLELWAWRKVKVKRGGKAVRWAARVHRLTAEDIG